MGIANGPPTASEPEKDNVTLRSTVVGLTAGGTAAGSAGQETFNVFPLGVPVQPTEENVQLATTPFKKRLLLLNLKAKFPTPTPADC